MYCRKGKTVDHPDSALHSCVVADGEDTRLIPIPPIPNANTWLVAVRRQTGQDAWDGEAQLPPNPL